MGKNLSFVLNNLEDLVAAFFISITTILVVINIVLRYVFNSGLVWSEEVATGCFVWSVFIGAVAVFKHRGHVGVDIIVKRMPQGMQKEGYRPDYRRYSCSAQRLHVLSFYYLYFQILYENDPGTGYFFRLYQFFRTDCVCTHDLVFY